MLESDGLRIGSAGAAMCLLIIREVKTLVRKRDCCFAKISQSRIVKLGYNYDYSFVSCNPQSQYDLFLS